MRKMQALASTTESVRAKLPILSHKSRLSPHYQQNMLPLLMLLQLVYVFQHLPPTTRTCSSLACHSCSLQAPFSTPSC